MAATISEVNAIATAVVDLANAAKSLKYLTDQALAKNAAHAIDWNDLPAGAVDANGYLACGDTPAEISNAVGSLAAYQTLWTTHGGNFEKLAKAIV